MKAPDEVVHELTRIGVKALAFAADVSNYDQVEAAVKATSEKFGGIDGAANMAGTIGAATWGVKKCALETIEDKDWD